MSTESSADLAKDGAGVPAPSSLPGPPTLRGLLPTLVINAALPYVAYQLLTNYVPSISKVMALAISASFPAAHSLFGVMRRRSFDVVGVIVVVGIAVSVVATLVGGDPKMLLIRESFVTGALGLIALSSLFWRRPLIFYMARQISGAHDPALVARFDALWQRPRGPRTFRVMTLVWGAVWIGEFVLRVIMVEMLTIPTVLAVSPFVFTAINLGLFAWTFAYARRVRRKAVLLSAR